MCLATSAEAAGGLGWFNEAYRGIPPWDIGRPQPEFLRLADSGAVTGSVLDVGCGTGEHTILFASRGYHALGVDSAPLAIEKAREKASQRGSKAEFQVADALRLTGLGKKFGAVIDSGLFHVFPDDERGEFVASVASVLNAGGRYYMLCFSEKEPADSGGPRRVTKEEIRGAFAKGWSVDSIRASRFASIYPDESGARAWFATVTRL